MKNTLTMSKRDRQLLEVCQRLARGELTRSAAAVELDIGERQVYRILKRYRTEGDAGVVHRLRGRSSNRGYTSETRARVIGLYKQREYRDYGPQLFSEVLSERLHIRIGAETVRQWLMAAGLVGPPGAAAVSQASGASRRHRHASAI
jgi:transposase